MEIHEKLDVFYRAAMDAAGEQSEALLQEYKTVYQEELLEYEKRKAAEQDSKERIEQERIRKAVNRRVSEERLQLKKEYSIKHEEKKEELFALVEERLCAYRRTSAYEEWIKEHVKRAMKYAAGEEISIYLDPEDAHLLNGLKAAFDCDIEMSEESFGGGIRVMIPSQNVLFDESFGSRITEEREKFCF